MQKTIEEIHGDTEGVVYQLPVYRFAGSSPDAPSAYIQAALHAGELPGVVAIHALMPQLRQAESEGRILGNITVVPAANPVGRAQYLSATSRAASISERAPTSTATFPCSTGPTPSALPRGHGGRHGRRAPQAPAGRAFGRPRHRPRPALRRRGCAYLYVPVELWPAMEDCAAAMGVEAVVLWQGSSGAAFEEAAIHPWLQMPPEEAGLDRRVVTTVEFRGQRDVESATADVGRRGHLQAARHARRHCRRSGRPAETLHWHRRSHRQCRDDLDAAGRRDSLSCRTRTDEWSKARGSPPSSIRPASRMARSRSTRRRRATSSPASCTGPAAPATTSSSWSAKHAAPGRRTARWKTSLGR